MTENCIVFRYLLLSTFYLMNDFTMQIQGVYSLPCSLNCLMVVTVAASPVPRTFTSVELSIFVNVPSFFKPILRLSYDLGSSWWVSDTLLCMLVNVSFVLFSSVQSLSRVWLFATPWIAARQASLAITNSRSSLRLTSIESVMPSSHLILCRPLLLLLPIPPSIKVFSNESALRIRWPKYWSFSFNISPCNEYSGLISFRMD